MKQFFRPHPRSGSTSSAGTVAASSPPTPEKHPKLAHHPTKVAVLGLGKVGLGLGHTLERGGYAVKYSHTRGERSKAEELEAIQHGEVIFLCVPGDSVVSMAAVLQVDFQNKVVVDVSNPCTWQDGPVYCPPAEGSLAQAIMSAAPKLRLVKAFNDVGVEQHRNPLFNGTPARMGVCSDDVGAKKLILDLACKLGFNAYDNGGLAMAAVSEKTAIDAWREFRLKRLLTQQQQQQLPPAPPDLVKNPSTDSTCPNETQKKLALLER
jgi:predicted dinucleotide-binding enzyme